MNAAFAYPGNLQGLSINNVDVTKLFNKSNPSQISALFELRDNILPNLSQALNQMATNLKEEINSIHNNGAGYPGALSLSGTRNVLGTDTFSGTGSFRIATLDNKGTIQQVADINLAGLANVNAAIAAINAGLNGTATAAIVNEKLNIQAHNGLSVAFNENTSQMLESSIKIELFDQNGTSLGVNHFATGGGLAATVANMNAAFGGNATARLDNGKIHITALNDDNNHNQIKLNDYPQQEGVTIRSKGFSGYFGLNDFFQGDTDPLSPSLSGSIKVNQALSTNSSLISSSPLSLTANVNERGLTPLGIKRSDNFTPSEAMRNVLSEQFLFHATGDMGSKTGSIQEYSGSILTNITSSVERSQKNQDTSKTILSTSVRAFEKLSKQDLSQSAQKLAELQVSLNFILQALAQEQQTDMSVANKLAARVA
jgi:hypothetical protein